MYHNNNINSTENHYYDGNSVYYKTASDQEDISADMDKSEPEQKTPYENDYEYLWNILENKYPYLAYIDENIVGTQDLHDRYALELENVHDDVGFMDLIHIMLGEMQHFAHLDILTPNEYQDLYSVLLLDEKSNSHWSAALNLSGKKSDISFDYENADWLLRVVQDTADIRKTER